MEADQLTKLFEAIAQGGKPASEVPTSSTRVHVGPLQDCHNEETLNALFSTCGEVEFVRLSGENQRSAQVQFKSEEGAQAAMQLKPPVIPVNMRIQASREVQGGPMNGKATTQEQVLYAQQISAARDSYADFQADKEEEKAKRMRRREKERRRKLAQRREEEGHSTATDSAFDSALETDERRKLRRERHAKRFVLQKIKHYQQNHYTNTEKAPAKSGGNGSAKEAT